MCVFNPSHSKILLTCGVGYDKEQWALSFFWGQVLIFFKNY
ncbi:hypothetical protein [Leptospira interrogans]|uniref:Uncharacterized protein n=1 Tax=Leptospira interrogans serovar Zanoni str. LT2156 TaxID=1001601 RepID=M6HD17_LEPIR|nr:hypothetical protein [Leptospira interrogans]EMM95218.1 hypothetical protein LEP1GSC158_0724 [Leptospira interrogans serovar Zanoni str. LT2156]